jgi:hypothetical protein
MMAPGLGPDRSVGWGDRPFQGYAELTKSYKKRDDNGMVEAHGEVLQHVKNMMETMFLTKK